jgi:hypothetical protein
VGADRVSHNTKTVVSRLSFARFPRGDNGASKHWRRIADRQPVALRLPAQRVSLLSGGDSTPSLIEGIVEGQRRARRTHCGSGRQKLIELPELRGEDLAALAARTCEAGRGGAKRTQAEPVMLGIRCPQPHPTRFEHTTRTRVSSIHRARPRRRKFRRPLCSDRAKSRQSSGRAPRKLLDRDATDEVLLAQLCPPLHVQHAPSPGLDNTIEPGSPTPRTPPPPPEGVNIQPAEEGQFSTGADTLLSRYQPQAPSTAHGLRTAKFRPCQRHFALQSHREYEEAWFERVEANLKETAFHRETPSAMPRPAGALRTRGPAAAPASRARPACP